MNNYKSLNETSQMDLSILIINYNTKELTTQAINSIHKNITRLKYEIVVVDNNSTDRSSDFIKRISPDVTLIPNEFNVGFSRANNQAANVATGKYLLFLNPDAIVQFGAIENMFEYLQSHQDTAIVGPRLSNSDNSLQRSCGIFPNLLTEFYGRSYLNRLLPNSPTIGGYKLAGWDYASPQNVDWVSGACFMMQKSTFDKLGGFDDRIYMFYEDVDLCYRTRELGSKIAFEPKASIYHLHGSSWKYYREIPIFYSCKSAIYFFEKHYPAWKAYILRFLILIEITVSFAVVIPYLFLNGEKIDGIGSRVRGYWAALKHIFARNNMFP